ncbi:Holliday junction resolvase RuvX [Glutamicibacter sp. BW78]|uniref:Holliday junction resolvase RuvX n=1 Tax=Glutamicibacter sp. BW78 TaxID=2024403 RepID=UPI000BB696C4|nr:Holliday junction resolvase RuvX [Glutamicibacter sp. BW78]PCC26594.1 Holliday junction resolvase RuvX [Glutamicibacter sp. BW78]
MIGSADPRPPRGVKLGVDVGMARVGVALCDPDGVLATPLKTLKRDLKKHSDVRVLLKLVAEHEAVQVFVGLPRSLRGHETGSTQMAREYAALVAEGLQDPAPGVSVRLIDERLTTVSAHRALHESGLDGRKHREVVDQVAAADILQQALDMQKSLGRDVGDPVVPGERPTSTDL